jgi:hypothetical protein
MASHCNLENLPNVTRHWSDHVLGKFLHEEIRFTMITCNLQCGCTVGAYRMQSTSSVYFTFLCPGLYSLSIIL